MSKPTKSVGDLWILCREPQVFAIMVRQAYKISTNTYPATNGREYVHLFAKALPKKLLEKVINDQQFRVEHGIIQVHFEQPVKTFSVGTGE
jgi:hypothetical protein